jgi:hypothetical protein
MNAKVLQLESATFDQGFLAKQAAIAGPFSG